MFCELTDVYRKSSTSGLDRRRMVGRRRMVAPTGKSACCVQIRDSWSKAYFWWFLEFGVFLECVFLDFGGELE
tara:strand:- start:113 stop:331 length:219 start_codon:yes stop_codon:yes gene_type:complete